MNPETYLLSAKNRLHLDENFKTDPSSSTSNE